MDSYSVKEAATVLGVPVGRVWELLARGVIAGAQEAGSGMRVYLRGTPAAVPAPVPFAEPAASGAGMGGAEAQKGRRNGGHDGPDASPFRELLTEFRNLTERYGQALLALGEARGEVAGLRTRVELLEARLDLRLPGPPSWTRDEPAPRPPAPAPATSPERAAAEEPRDVPAEIQAVEETEDVSAEIRAVEETEDVSAEIQAAFAETPVVVEAAAQPVVEPVEPAVVEAAAQPVVEPVEPVVVEAAAQPVVEPVEPVVAEPAPEPEAAPSDALEPAVERRAPHRRRGSRSAVSGIAAALARADDPTLAGLPGGDEAAEALAALRRDLAAADAAAEPVAEPAPEPAPEPVSKPTPEAASTSGSDALAGSDAVAPVPELPEPGPAPFAPEPEGVAEAAAEPDVGGEVLAAPRRAEAEAEAAPSVYSSEWDEPDWIAEEDLEQGWQSAADHGVEADREVGDRAAPEAEPVTQAVADIETVPEQMTEEPMTEEPMAEEPMAEEPEPEEADVASMSHWPLPTEDLEQVAEPIEVAEQPRVAEPEPPAEPASPAGQAPVTELAAAPEPPVEPEQAVEREQAESDAFEEEVMWLGDEFRPSTTAWQPLGAGQREAPGRYEAPAPSTPPIEEVALERLARQRGWDATELSAIRSLLGDRAPTPSPGEPEPAVSQQPMSLSPASRADESSAASEADAWEHAPAAWLPPVAARPPLELPGAVELDEAMAALGAAETPAEVQVEEPSVSTPRAWSKAGDSAPVAEPPIEPVAEKRLPEPGDGEEVAEAAAEPAGELPASAPPAPSPPPIEERHETVASAAEPSGTAGTAHEPPAPMPAPGSAPVVRPVPPRPVDQAWLRGRRGPAANAYRRLRRLFPG